MEGGEYLNHVLGFDVSSPFDQEGAVHKHTRIETRVPTQMQTQPQMQRSENLCGIFCKNIFQKSPTCPPKCPTITRLETFSGLCDATDEVR